MILAGLVAQNRYGIVVVGTANGLMRTSKAVEKSNGGDAAIGCREGGQGGISKQCREGGLAYRSGAVGSVEARLSFAVIASVSVFT